MKVSVVVTVLNEENTIVKLLDSLLVQTKEANEIVVVDGSSNDKTAEIINRYQKKGARVIVFIEPCSIAEGRNFGIKMAKSPIIAQIDAGCVAKDDWLEKLIEPFERKAVEVVAGFYVMTGDSTLQRAVKPFLGTPQEWFKPETFLPSARSMAFRKSVWKKIGGFSEKLEKTSEDTLFNYNLIKRGIKIIRAKDALVYWEMPKTFSEILSKLYNYARGDSKSRIWWHPLQRTSTHNIKIMSIFARYLVVFLFLFFSINLPELLYILMLGFLIYLGWSIIKMRDVVKDAKARLWLPVIQVASDFAIMAGFLSGLWRK